MENTVEWVGLQGSRVSMVTLGLHCSTVGRATLQ